VIPQTITKEFDVTVPITKGETKTHTGYSTIVVSENNTVWTSVAPPPTTIVVPTTEAGDEYPPVETYPSVVPTAAAVAREMSPAVALVAGVLGAVAML